MSKWRPIETAPKDGTHILLWVPKDEPQIIVGYHDKFQQSDGTVDEWWTYADRLLQDVAGEIVKPTHWIPLPAPPST